MPRPDPVYQELGWQPRYTSRGLVYVDICGRRPRVAPEAVPAAEAMNLALLHTGYESPCDWVGSWNYRNVAGSTQLSRHAYALAIDLDYGGDTDGDGDPTIDSNPHLHDAILQGDPRFGVEFQITEAQVTEVESIRTGNGLQVWRWLGWINGDTMHFDIMVGPDDLATGIIYQPTEGESPMMELSRWVTMLRPTDIIQMGETGILLTTEVAYWQGKLIIVKEALAAGQSPDDAVDDEWQDLRDAVAVRSPIWVG